MNPKVSKFLDQARQRKERGEKRLRTATQAEGALARAGSSASKSEINRPPARMKCFLFISRARPARPRSLPIADLAAAHTKSGERKTCAKVQPALPSRSVANRSSAPGRMIAGKTRQHFAGQEAASVMAPLWPGIGIKQIDAVQGLCAAALRSPPGHRHCRGVHCSMTPLR